MGKLLTARPRHKEMKGVKMQQLRLAPRLKGATKAGKARNVHETRKLGKSATGYLLF